MLDHVRLKINHCVLKIIYSNEDVLCMKHMIRGSMANLENNMEYGSKRRSGYHEMFSLNIHEREKRNKKKDYHKRSHEHFLNLHCTSS